MPWRSTLILWTIIDRSSIGCRVTFQNSLPVRIPRLRWTGILLKLSMITSQTTLWQLKMMLNRQWIALRGETITTALIVLYLNTVSSHPKRIIWARTILAFQGGIKTTIIMLVKEAMCQFHSPERDKSSWLKRQSTCTLKKILSQQSKVRNIKSRDILQIRNHTVQSF